MQDMLTDLWDRTTNGINAFSEAVSDSLVKVFGNANERQIRRLRPRVASINELEP